LGVFGKEKTLLVSLLVCVVAKTKRTQMYVRGLVGYLGLICATVPGLLVPVISVQLVPFLVSCTKYFYLFLSILLWVVVY
jgi:hypothetical protein